MRAMLSDCAGLTEGQQLRHGGVLLAAVQRRTVGPSESWRLEKHLQQTADKHQAKKKQKKTSHNLSKALLVLHVGLALVVDAGFAVLAPQCKLVVH